MRKLLLLTLLLTRILTVGATEYDAPRTALRDSILANVSGATLNENSVLITKFGAKGDSKTDCRTAFAKAMKYAEKRGGARIVVPKGVWLCKGPIHFVSNVTLDICEGATLKFVAEPSAYLPMVETSWEGTYLWNYSPFIYGKGLRNVAIVGKGTIDGDAGETFAKWKPVQGAGQMLSRKMNHEGTPVAERRFGEGYNLRPHLIQFYDCKDITIADVFICRAPFWCVHLLKSENIILRGIRYDAKLINNDGIDIESSRDILIDDVFFNNGDDNIAIKSGRDNDGWTMSPPSENIVVRNCHFKGLHALVIGSEMSGGVQNVVVEDCDYSGYCKRGIYIKTNPDRGGFVRNIFVKNVQFGEVLDLFHATSMYAGQGMDNTHFSEVSGIHVDSLTATKVTGTALIIQGTKEKPIRDVTFRNLMAPVVANGLSIENTEPVLMEHCFLGLPAGVPTQASEKDAIFSK